jgi:hypothetical protein
MFHYLNLDCTQNVNVSFDVDVSTLKAGMIFTVYLISMLESDNPTDMSVYTTASTGIPYVAPALVNNLTAAKPALNYDANWGIGYRDASGLVCGGCIEIDIIELTSSGAVSTAHGMLTESPPTYDPSGSWTNCWGSYGDGSSYVNHFDGTTQYPPYGPGASFTINTLRPFSVSAAISGNSNTLSLITTLTQGANSITLQPQNIQGFDNPTARAQLAKMNLVTATWTTSTSDPTSCRPETTSWWLDGIDPENYADIRSYASCELTSPPLPNALQAFTLPHDKLYYFSYSSPASSAVEHGDTDAAETFGPVFSRIQNMVVSIPGGSAQTDWAWSLDADYRAISTNADLYNNWHGQYGNGFGMAVATNLPIDVYSPNTASPSLWQSNVIGAIAYTQATQFAELSGFGTTDPVLFSAQTTSPVYSGNLQSFVLLNVLNAHGGVTVVNSRQTTPISRH